MSEKDGPAPPLDVVQRWFQSVITHPGGAALGVGSEEAQRLVPLTRDDLEALVPRSRGLTAIERLSIYAHAYYARLLECLGEVFPILRRTLGDEAFESLAFEYLQSYPSRSYTLDRLGERFPAFLDETRPDRGYRGEGGAPLIGWPDFLIDLARLEWAIAKVFDGPGVEGQTLLRADDLQALGPERFAAVRLAPVPCLRLVSFRFPVNGYYTAVRETAEGEAPPPPAAGAEHVALTRTDWIVRRHALHPVQHALLAALVDGVPVGKAVAAAAAASDLPDAALGDLLMSSFRIFTAAGFFAAVE